MIKKLLGVLAMTLTCSVALAADSGYKLDNAPDRINNMASLQNGAKLFVNYCLGCHSAVSMRYNKLTELGLTDEQIQKNLLFTTDKIGDLMTIAMTRPDAANWFGAAPPDLSVIARAKSANLGPSGVDYIYTFLRTYYRDTTKKTGWDNAVFPSVGMPNVLWELQGPVTYTESHIHKAEQDGNMVWQRTNTSYDPMGYADTKTEVLQNYRGGEATQHNFQGQNQAAFDNNVADLANFLGWMAEPNQLYRKRLGVWVLLFLGLFLVVAWRLNAAYWKHVK